MDEATRLQNGRESQGIPLMEMYLYKALGIYKTQEEINIIPLISMGHMWEI